MNLALDIGLASVYFITDPDRGIAMLQSPRLLLASRTLSLEDFARFIARSQRTGGQKDDARFPDALQMLNDVLAEDRPSSPIFVNEPILVIACDIEAGLLSGLKRLKLRGFARLMAVKEGIGSTVIEAAVTQLYLGFRDRLVYAEGGRELLAFGPVAGLCVVSGLRKTVLSTEKDCQAIMRSYPDLAADVSGVIEPI